MQTDREDAVTDIYDYTAVLGLANMLIQDVYVRTWRMTGGQCVS